MSRADNMRKVKKERNRLENERRVATKRNNLAQAMLGSALAKL